MRCKSTSILVLVIAVLVFSYLPAFGQETGLSGVVSDAQGAVIPGVKVVVQQTGGSTFSAVTNAQGVYVVPNLIAAEYTITASAPGFASVEKRTLVLVGQLAQVDLSLPVASTAATLVVEAGAQIAIDTTGSIVAGNVTPDEVQNVPVNGRSYVELSSLVAGIKGNAFGNAPVSGPGGAQEGDEETGKFQVTLDGLQLSQDSVGSSFGQPKVSQDAISQFQIITNRFDATAGRSAGVYVNVQTKTGGNQMHGSAFGYFRNSFFNASDPITGKVLPFSDEQYGGTLGGPVRKDKLWYFGSYEGEHQPGTVSSEPYITTTAGSVYSHSSIYKVNEYLGRLDYQMNDKNHFFLRGDGFTQDTSFVGASDPSQSYYSTVTAAGYVFDWNRTIRDNLINDFHAGFHYFQFGNFPFFSDNSIVLDLPEATVGEPYNEPEVFTQDTQQYRDDLFWLKGKHSIKIGGEYLYTLHGGAFPQYLRGGLTSCSSTVPASQALYNSFFPSGTLDPSTWNYAAINKYCNAAESYTQAYGNYNIRIARNIIGVWAQDDWKILPRLTFNLGLRYDNDLGAYNTSYVPTPGLLTPNTNPNFNFGPRLGFAYDPLGDGKTLIRGGAGMYYADQVANAIIDEELYSSTARALQATLSGTSLALPTPFAGQNPDSDPQNYVSSPQPVQRGAKTPYALQASLGVARQLPMQATVTMDFFHVRVYDDFIALSGNLLENPANPEQNLNPSSAMNATVYGERVCGNGGILLDTLNVGTLSTDAPGGGVAKQVCNQLFGAAVRNFTVYPGAGDISDNLAVSIRHAMTNGFTGAIAYTWGRTKDSTIGAFGYPNKPFKSGIQQEWANGTDDQRHTLTVTGQYRWRYGLQLSSLYHFGSGLAYAATSGSTINGYASSTRTFTSQPIAPGQTCPVSSCTTIYAPLSKVYYDQAYGYWILQRDGFRGTPYNRVDARLQKTITIKERYNAILGFEAFNLFNHSNYGNFALSATTGTGANAYGHQTSVSTEGASLEYFGRNLQFFGRFSF
jgi:hypothetical protein